MLRKISYYGLLIGTVVFFALFFFYPVFQVLKGGLRDSEGKLTFFYLAEVFRNPIYLEGLLNSVKIAICSTLVAVLPNSVLKALRKLTASLAETCPEPVPP
jgi:ABC-type uncharacterized transport system permease subunit